MTFREFHQQKRSNNRSGVPGVHFLKTRRQPQGAWQEKIKLPNGGKITKTFSVRKFLSGRYCQGKHPIAGTPAGAPRFLIG
jgi:hypothetical protein